MWLTSLCAQVAGMLDLGGLLDRRVLIQAVHVFIIVSVVLQVGYRQRPAAPAAQDTERALIRRPSAGHRHLSGEQGL